MADETDFLGPFEAVALQVHVDGGLAGVVDRFVVPAQRWHNWCWAALGAGIAVWSGKKVSQCQLASTLCQPNDCCGPSGSDPHMCNVEKPLADALRAVGFDSPAQSGSPSFATIQSEVKAQRPVCIRIKWSDGGGNHFIAVSGWRQSQDGTTYLLIDDPDGGVHQCPLPLDEVKNNYRGRGLWWETHFIPPVVS